MPSRKSISYLFIVAHVRSLRGSPVVEHINAAIKIVQQQQQQQRACCAGYVTVVRSSSNGAAQILCLLSHGITPHTLPLVDMLIELCAIVNIWMKPQRYPGCNGPLPEGRGSLTAAREAQLRAKYTSNDELLARLMANVTWLWENRYTEEQLSKMSPAMRLEREQATTQEPDIALDLYGAGGTTRRFQDEASYRAAWVATTEQVAAQKLVRTHTPWWFLIRNQDGLGMLATASMLYTLRCACAYTRQRRELGRGRLNDSQDLHVWRICLCGVIVCMCLACMRLKCYNIG